MVLRSPERKRGRRRPGYTWNQFANYHIEAGGKLHAYQSRMRKNGVRLDTEVRAEIGRALAYELHAHNAEARLGYGWAALHYLQCFFAKSPRPKRIGWLTLIFEDHAMSEDAAASFDPREVQARVCGLLGDASFVGCVDTAYYLNVGEVTERRTRTVSWHVHLLVWGCLISELEALVRDLNAAYPSLLPGVDPAYLRIIERDEALRQLLYMLRMAAQEYQAWPKKRMGVDRSTGEIIKVNAGPFRQRSRPARPGTLSRLARIMSGLYIDELTFAGGAGRRILDRINRYATAQLRASWQAHRPH